MLRSRGTRGWAAPAALLLAVAALAWLAWLTARVGKPAQRQGRAHHEDADNRAAAVAVATLAAPETSQQATPTTPTTPLHNFLRPCNNVVTRTLSPREVRDALRARYEWTSSMEPVEAISRALAAAQAPAGSWKDKCSDIKACNVAQSTGWSHVAHNHTRFALMGPVAKVCREVRRVGKGDEEKRLCWSDELLRSGCTIFSIGSNNQWGYELEMAKITPCEIHTFDCTVRRYQIPAAIQDRTTMHKVCLGPREEIAHGMNFTTLEGAMRIAGVKHVDFLKMDIEGYEWDVLPAVVDNALQRLARTGEDIFPTQMSVEVHYVTQMPMAWRGRDRTPGEILGFFNSLFLRGGYLLADRNDNPHCHHCTEIVLAKAWCPA